MILYQYRTNSITTHHSVPYTIAFGKLIELGQSLGHPNWGLFFFAILHFVLLTLAFGYALQLIKSAHLNKYLVTACAFFWLINPYIIGFIGVIIKDIPYAACAVIIITAIIELSLNYNKFITSPCRIALLFISTCLLCLMRNNGIIVMFGILIFLFYRIIRNREHIMVIVIVLAALLSSMAINSGSIAKYHAEPSSIGEMLSVPLQQTARFVKYHEEDVSASDKEIIDSVVDYSILADHYDPRIADPVKGNYRNNNRYLPAYFKVWAKHLLKHPLCYVSAYCNQYYYVFVPASNQDNIFLYRDFDTGFELLRTIVISETTPFYEDLFTNPRCLESPKDWIISICRGLHSSPVVGLVFNLSISVYILLILLSRLLIDRKRCMLEYGVCLISLLILLVGPVVYGQPRYFFPISYSVPLLFTYYLSVYRCDQAD